MLNIVPRDFNEDANLDRLVTNHKPVDNDLTTFNIDGVFSPSIFGNLSNSVDWSCNCGEITGEFNKGVHCVKPNCNSVVDYKGLSIDREGWIDLVYPLIHPLFFRYIRKVIGVTALEKIIHYKADIKVEGHLTEPELVYPYTGIGIEAFIANFEQILGEFVTKKNTVGGDAAYHFLMENVEKVFINYFPVINSKLRPAIVINGEFSFDAINSLYNSIILNSNLLRGLTSPERIPLNILSLSYKNQTLINTVYENIISSISNKEGYIRSTLFGNRLNFTSRSVITPLSGDFNIDDAVIPYIAAVELFKPQIIRKLAKLKNITFVKADALWFKATLEFDSMVYKIMKELIKKDNVNLLINRNPTISLGSILFLRIRDIKTDLSDLTTSIHNLILKPLAADYDGDVLNFILVFSDRFTQMFDKFRPHNILVDIDTGGFNKAFLPSKDTLLGLESLFS